MLTDQDQSQETPVEVQAEQLGPTAKQMAAVEEANAKRLVDQARANELRAKQAEFQAEPIINLASKGRQALEDAMRAQRAQQAAKPPYVPPAMTERQKTALQEEMEAGARRVAVAQAQKIRAGHPTLPQPKDSNEGVTNPVHRPGEFVPGLYSKDPAIK